jgi:hypothetical protein
MWSVMAARAAPGSRVSIAPAWLDHELDDSRDGPGARQSRRCPVRRRDDRLFGVCRRRARPWRAGLVLFDERIRDYTAGNEVEFRELIELGGVRTADDPAALAGHFGLPAEALAATIEEARRGAAAGTPDRLGATISASAR